MARGRRIDDAWREDATCERVTGELLELGVEGERIGRLHLVVELLDEARAPRVSDATDVTWRSEPHGERRRPVAHQVHIERDALSDRRPLNLDRDWLALVGGLVDLAQRGRGDGLLRDAREDDPGQVVGDDLLRLARREGRHVLLQHRQRLDVRRWQQVTAYRRTLADLDEGGPQLDQKARELLASRVRILTLEALARQHIRQ